MPGTKAAEKAEKAVEKAVKKIDNDDADKKETPTTDEKLSPNEETKEPNVEKEGGASSANSEDSVRIPK